jgi:hypothetical protein
MEKRMEQQSRPANEDQHQHQNGLVVADLISSLREMPEDWPITDQDGAQIINAFKSTFKDVTGNQHECIALESREVTEV